MFTPQLKYDLLVLVIDYETNCTITVLHITNNLTEA